MLSAVKKKIFVGRTKQSEEPDDAIMQEDGYQGKRQALIVHYDTLWVL